MSSTALPALKANQTAGKREIILVLDGETLHSTWKQKAVVAGGLTIMGALFTVGAFQIHDTPSAAAAVAAIGTAYLFAGMKYVHICCQSPQFIEVPEASAAELQQILVTYLQSNGQTQHESERLLNCDTAC